MGKTAGAIEGASLTINGASNVTGASTITGANDVGGLQSSQTLTVGTGEADYLTTYAWGAFHADQAPTFPSIRLYDWGTDDWVGVISVNGTLTVVT